MNVSILAIGSQGDVRPAAALAAALAARGSRVRLAAPDAFASLVDGANVDFRSLGVDVLAEGKSELTQGLFESGGDLVAYARWLVAMSKRVSAAIAPRIFEATRDSDVIVGTGFLQPFGVMASEYWRTPSVHAWLWPAVASADFLCSLGPPPPFALPNWANRLAFGIGDQFVWLLVRRALQDIRTRYGLSRAGLSPDLRRAIAKGEPILLPFSEALLPRSREWPDNIHVSGYWRLAERADWRPSAELVSFLAAGPRPVYISFGSMRLEEPVRTFDLIVNAVRAVGARAIIGAGWGGLQSASPDADVHVVGDIPHHWLFAHVDAIVHHGGAGTVGAVIAAGKPSVVVPFILDQHFWGQRLQMKGVTPPAIPFRKLTSANLATAIRTALTDEGMRTRARDLAHAVAAEAGLANAAAVVEAAARRK